MLCVVLLAGATFAWFTDTASTSVSKIESGKLKVAIVDTNGNELANGLTFVGTSENGQSNSNILWEPNATYKTESFKIKNNGNLSLKYKLAITGINGDAELLDVITFTLVKVGTDNSETEITFDTSEDTLSANDATSNNTYYLKGHMDENAGNEYQGKTLTGVSVSVTAAQHTGESDSKDSTYDQSAEYATVVTSDAELTTALGNIATTAANVSITLAEDVDLTTGLKVETGSNLDVNFGGKTVTAATATGSTGTTTNGMQLLKGSAVTLKDGTYAMNPKTIHYLIQNYSDLTIDNMELSTVDYTQLGTNAINSGMAVISTNCGNVTITGNTNITAHDGSLALDICHWEGTGYEADGTHVTFDENFTGVCDGGISIYCYNASNATPVRTVDDGGATLTIKGGTFKNTGMDFDTFKTYVADGYTATETSTGSEVYTVAPATAG